MFGNVQVAADSPGNVIIIPASAIVGATGQPQVFVVQEGKAVLQDIIVSKRMQNRVVISAGLKEGDVIVTNGFINLFDSANVVIKN